MEVSAVAGLFSKQATAKLEELFSTLFRVAPGNCPFPRWVDNHCGPRYTGRVTVEELGQLELPDDATWSTALEEARAHKYTTVQDVALTRDLFAQLIVAAGRKDDDSPFELTLRCEGVVFRDQIWFDNVHLHLFMNQCRFDDPFHSGAAFEDAIFRDVTFMGKASFTEATFTGSTEFTRVRFDGGADFYKAQFRGNTAFNAVSFVSTLFFWDAKFAAPVRFSIGVGDRAEPIPADQFGSEHAWVDFSRAAFEDSVRFDIRTTGAAEFPDVTFGRRASMHVSAETIAFDRAHFSDNANVMVHAEQTSFAEARFERPFVIGCSGDVVADGAVFAEDGTIVGPQPGIAEPGRLRSVRGANLSKLTLARLDLSGCLFADAHSLDELRIESTCTFARPPESWRFAARRTIAEENLWRGGQWRVPPFDAWFLDHVEPPSVLDPAEIACIYRSLRKATESRKDEPGAADFYYGEMEMRRHAPRRLSGERLVLTVFWAVSGYALRAMRAVVALAVICIALAIAFRADGFVQPHSFGDMLIYSFGASARVKTGFENDALTSTGEVLHILLGIVGPILYGLALLSLRGRVKR